MTCRLKVDKRLQFLLSLEIRHRNFLAARIPCKIVNYVLTNVTMSKVPEISEFFRSSANVLKKLFYLVGY